MNSCVPDWTCNIKHITHLHGGIPMITFLKRGLASRELENNAVYKDRRVSPVSVDWIIILDYISDCDLTTEFS